MHSPKIQHYINQAQNYAPSIQLINSTTIYWRTVHTRYKALGPYYRLKTDQIQQVVRDSTPANLATPQ